MTQEINSRFVALKEYVDKQLELIVGINNAIENDGFRPSKSQQKTIDYICQQGRSFLIEIERLKNFKKITLKFQ